RERAIKELGGYGGGIGRDGGLAEYVLVPSTRYLVGIDGLDPVAAAPLSDAALTPYHAIQRSPHQLRPNGAAVVIGVGGIGHLAVQLLRALSEVRVVAVDLPFECSVYVPSWGTISELAEVVALARAGAIHTEVQRLDLDETLDGYRRLQRGEVVGRAVAVP